MAGGKLTQAAVNGATQAGMYGDGDGLYLQVAGPTARSWIYRYTLNKRERWHGLGSAQTFTLAEARKLRDEVKITKVRHGIDPVGERKNAEQQDVLAKARATPFRQRAEQYMDAHADSWRNAKHRTQWRSTLVTYVYPTIGDIPASAVTAGHIVEILRPIWADKPETARRVRGRVEAVLDYAADPDDPLYRNPAAMTAQLLKKLPKPAKDKAPVHHPSMPYDQIGAFMASLREREGTAARALEFVILTTARTNEGLGAQWSEFNLGSAVWTVPGERMKSGREHRVPLSLPAVRMLKRLQETATGEVVFPSPQDSGPLSDAALLAVLHRLGRHDITVHGFRSTFRTWAAEQTNFANEVCEAALAHVIKDKTEAAYQRGDLFEKRRRLMNAWADYAARSPAGAVVRIQRAS